MCAPLFVQPDSHSRRPKRPHRRATRVHVGWLCSCWVAVCRLVGWLAGCWLAASPVAHSAAPRFPWLRCGNPLRSTAPSATAHGRALLPALLQRAPTAGPSPPCTSQRKHVALQDVEEKGAAQDDKRMRSYSMARPSRRRCCGVPAARCSTVAESLTSSRRTFSSLPTKLLRRCCKVRLLFFGAASCRACSRAASSASARRPRALRTCPSAAPRRCLRRASGHPEFLCGGAEIRLCAEAAPTEPGGWGPFGTPPLRALEPTTLRYVYPSGAPIVATRSFFAAGRNTSVSGGPAAG